MIISLWINESDKGSDEVWYIGFVTDTCDDSQDEVIVDHLHPKDKSLARWRYPPKSDECRVDRRQIIISVRPQFDWDLSARNPILTIKNYKK